ncbi:uncharacterized protein LOC123691879 [Colias croceus]|uniref:uncharacterized protein LOC123691879 n=1 Tax=Colias crocea TaxID=72248 RepID=UPI001E27C169|nr:uncharacterized protein LOC123691879 [Colias croceus]
MDNMETFFERMKIEMTKQTEDIISRMDEKLAPLSREVEDLKLENRELKKKITMLEKNRRHNNLILYGLEESEESTMELLQATTKKISTDLKISLDIKDINEIRRIGKKFNGNDRARPVLISFLNCWKKGEILKNKKKFKNAYVSEDYPKEVQIKRKELREKMLEERKKGNFAVLDYDKLVIKEKPLNNEKRKRDLSITPETSQQPRKQHAPSKNCRANAFDLMRGRSSSLSSINKSNDQRQ